MLGMKPENGTDIRKVKKWAIMTDTKTGRKTDMTKDIAKDMTMVRSM